MLKQIQLNTKPFPNYSPVPVDQHFSQTSILLQLLFLLKGSVAGYNYHFE
jgi:hypothetical protein